MDEINEALEAQETDAEAVGEVEEAAEEPAAAVPEETEEVSETEETDETDKSDKSGEEEEPVAVCNAKMDDSLLKKAFSVIYKKLRFMSYLMMALGAICVGTFIAFRDDSFMLMIGIFLLVFGLFYLLFVSFFLVKKNMNTFRTMNGDSARYEFYGDHVASATEKGRVNYSYSTFFKAIEKEGLWLVYMGDRMAPLVLLIPKDGFEGDGCAFFENKVLANVQKQ